MIRNDEYDIKNGELASKADQSLSIDMPATEIRTCPKCESTVDAFADECRACGIVISKYRALSEAEVPEVRADGWRDLIDMWQNVLGHYDNDVVHEKFIAACDEADQLAYAAHKYARILSVTPQEDTARVMRERIRGLSLSKLDRRAPERIWEFRRPMAIDIVIAFAAFAFVAGLMLPGQGWLAGFAGVTSLAMICLRVFLTPPRST